MFINSVLEQFAILPLVNLKLDYIDISITNQTILLDLVILFLYMTFWYTADSNGHFYMQPSRVQLVIELLFKFVVGVMTNNMDLKTAERFFPFVISIFFFILTINFLGLVPYSFTVTSHFVVTFAFSLYLFIGIIILTVRKHGVHALELFLPAGTPMLVAFLLVPVEIISYVFKPISLSIRLFANMMAGHTLLKVIAFFSFCLLDFSGVLGASHLAPLLLLAPLMLLETAVAFIQALVFVILVSMYLNEAAKLH